MSRWRPRARRGWAVGLVLAGMLGAQAAGQDARRASPGDASLAAAKRLAGFQEFSAAGEWDAAIDVLDQLAREFGEALVEVEPGRFLNVGRACRALVSRLPAAGLLRYRQRVDASAGEAFRAALERDDANAMRRIARDGFASSWGDDALAWLAESEWHAGRIDAARALWTLLVPLAEAEGDSHPLVLRYPDADLSPAEVRARLVLCSMLKGDARRANEELAAFRRMHPDATGPLCGEEGRLVDILERTLAASREWSPAIVGSSDGREEGYVPRADALRWERPLPSAALPLVAPLRPALGTTSPLSYLPVVWNDVVLVNDGHTVWGWRLPGGGPAWPTGAADDAGAVYISPTPDAELGLPTAGVPRYTATVADGRCYARLGRPIATVATGELQRPQSSVVCLDLAEGEGRLAWSALPEQTLEGAEWTFTGAPVVAYDGVFIPIRRATPQVEIGVACLDGATGQRLWQRRVCGTLAQAPAAYHVVAQDQLVLCGDLVIQATDAGLVAGLEAASGVVRWAVSYPSRERSPRERSDPARSGLCALVCSGGVVYAAPADSEELLAIDAESGVVLWRRASPQGIVELVAVVDGVLIAAGNQLWGLDVLTGDGAWPGAVGYSDPAGFGYGRPAGAGGRVYWTTREDLFVVEAGSGRIVKRTRLPLSAGRSGGNVVVAGETLLLARPEQVDAFGPAP